MKRTLSILLAALLLLIALPTFAEGETTLRPGMYIGEGNREVMYLDENGCGVLNYYDGEQDLANGVLWTETTMEIERATIPFAVMGDAVVFTFDNAVRIFHYASEGTEYALGDRENTSFAGTYLAADGRRLILAADGQGVYGSADGEAPIFWGSLLPYWSDIEGVTENECYVLFDSYLSGMEFADGTATVKIEGEDPIVFVRQAQAQPAGEGQLYYGYRMTTGGQTVDLIPFLTSMGMDPRSIYLELRADGTGTLLFMDEENKIELTWTEDTFTVDGDSVSYTREGDHILLTIEGESIEFAPAAEIEALLGSTGTDVIGEPETVPADAAGLVGTWTFTKARAMGMEIPADTMGTSMGLVLNGDGTAVLSTNDQTNDMEWFVQEDGTVALTVAGTEVFTLTFDGTDLILNTGAGVEMVFEKSV